MPLLTSAINSSKVQSDRINLGGERVVPGSGGRSPTAQIAGSLPFGVLTAGSLFCGWSLRGGLSPQHPLDIRQHLLRLLAPVSPACACPVAGS